MKKVYGVGIKDVTTQRNDPIYRVWANILRRCYTSIKGGINSSYVDCTVCDSWLYFSNFRSWYLQQELRLGSLKGFHIDKDVKVIGNKVYSPETCIMLPSKVNESLIFHNKNTELPLGVNFRKDRNKYKAEISINSKSVSLGSFSCPLEAHKVYQVAKVQVVKESLIPYYKDKTLTLEECRYVMAYVHNILGLGYLYNF